MTTVRWCDARVWMGFHGSKISSDGSLIKMGARVAHHAFALGSLMRVVTVRSHGNGSPDPPKTWYIHPQGDKTAMREPSARHSEIAASLTQSQTLATTLPSRSAILGMLAGVSQSDTMVVIDLDFAL